MEQERKQNRMGTEREGKLLLSMGWPIILSMLVQALYNIVDSIFVSRLDSLSEEALIGILGDLYDPSLVGYLGDKALNALSTVYPMQMLMIAIAVGTAIGINSLISRRLGARRFEDANRAAGNGIIVLLLSAAAFTVIGLTLSELFLEWQDSDPIVRRFGTEYMRICLGLSVGVFLSIGVERIMTAQGRTVFAMIIQMTGAVVNIVLDRVFVLGWGPIPAMGVTGAAVATVVGQFASMILAILLMALAKHEIHPKLADYRLNRRVIWEIYRVGLPSILGQAIGTILTFGMNNVLRSLGELQMLENPGINYVDAYKGAYGAYFKLQSVIFMPVFGLTTASMSVIGYNFGARNRKRLMRVFWVTMLYCCVFMALGTLVFQLGAEQIISLFDVSEYTRLVSIQAVKTISWSFIPAAACISMITVFNGTDTGLYGATISLSRQLVVLLPLAALFAWVFTDIQAVWIAFPISEAAALLLACFLFLRLYRKKFKPLDEEPKEH